MDKIKIYADYHTHTRYSDGRTSVEDNILAAIEKKLNIIGISDHGFGSPRYGALTRKKAARQKEEIEQLRGKYENIEILQGIEADLVSLEGDLDLEEHDYINFDYIIVGVHRFATTPNLKAWWNLYKRGFFPFLPKPSKKELAKNTEVWIKAIERNPIDILAHFNSVFYAEAKPVAECCAANNVLFELNSKHLSRIKHVFEDVLKTDVKLIASSDAHRKSDVGNISKILEFLKDYPEAIDRVVNFKPEKIIFKKDKL